MKYKEDVKVLESCCFKDSVVELTAWEVGDVTMYAAKYSNFGTGDVELSTASPSFTEAWENYEIMVEDMRGY